MIIISSRSEISGESEFSQKIQGHCTSVSPFASVPGHTATMRYIREFNLPRKLPSSLYTSVRPYVYHAIRVLKTPARPAVESLFRIRPLLRYRCRN